MRASNCPDLAFAKGKPGFEAREEQQAHREQSEREIKLAAKRRDGFKCRCPRGPHLGPLEGAHLTHKGMGGDKQMLRTTVALIVTLCRHHHRAQRGSLDSGDLAVEWGDAQADGPLMWMLDGAYVGTTEPVIPVQDSQ